MACATIFHQEDDYEAFERILADGLSRYAVRLFGYELMPNHCTWCCVPTAMGDEPLPALDHRHAHDALPRS